MPSLFSLSHPATLFQVWFVVYLYLSPFLLYATWTSLALMDLSQRAVWAKTADDLKLQLAAAEKQQTADAARIKDLTAQNESSQRKGQVGDAVTAELTNLRQQLAAKDTQLAALNSQLSTSQTQRGEAQQNTRELADLRQRAATAESAQQGLQAANAALAELRDQSATRLSRSAGNQDQATHDTSPLGVSVSADSHASNPPYASRETSGLTTGWSPVL